MDEPLEINQAAPPEPRKRDPLRRMVSTDAQGTTTMNVSKSVTKDLGNSPKRSVNTALGEIVSVELTQTTTTTTTTAKVSFAPSALSAQQCIDKDDNDDDDSRYVRRNAPLPPPIKDSTFSSKQRRSAEQEPELESEPEEVEPRDDSLRMYTVIVGGLFVLVIAMVASKSFFTSSSPVPKKEPIRCPGFLHLRSKYPNLDSMLWSTLVISVERAINENPGEPATFIFLYDSSSVGESVLMDVLQITLECFGSRSAIWRSSDDFRSAEIAADYGVHLQQHRQNLEAQGVLVVRDLDQVPPNAAQVFFTICDSYEPLVRKAIIFFTIDITRQHHSEEGKERPNRSATSIAEGILKGLWRRELNANVLNPLVIRLTENVFTIE